MTSKDTNQQDIQQDKIRTIQKRSIAILLDFPDSLRTTRKKLGIKQVQLAKVLGCASCDVCRWEQGIQFPRYPTTILTLLFWLAEVNNTES